MDRESNEIGDLARTGSKFCPLGTETRTDNTIEISPIIYAN